MLKSEGGKRPALIRRFAESLRMALSTTYDKAGPLCTTKIMILNPLSKFDASIGFPTFIQNNPQTICAGL